MTYDYETDILVIGAGAVGTAITREFSKYGLSVLCVDKNEDVGGDASKSCSAISGTGYNETGLVAKLEHDAWKTVDRLIDDLEIPANRCGHLLPAFNEEEMQVLEKRLARAKENGDLDVRLLTREEVLAEEPFINPAVVGGLLSPREIEIDPFMLVIAQAENAAANGAVFLTDCRVTGLALEASEDPAYLRGRIEAVTTTKGTIKAGYVINAAGLYCDEISLMADGEIDFTEHPRKGQFLVLDRDTRVRPNHIIMPVPTPYTRGKLVFPSAHGNVLLGPTAEDGEDRTDHSTTAEGLADVIADVRKLMPDLVIGDTITQFAGLRPVRTPEGYHIGWSEKTENFFALSGLRSDGVSTSLGVAHYVADLFREKGIELIEKPDFIGTRRAIESYADATPERQAELLAKDPRYGNMICRCESVSEAEIVEAIRRVPGAKSLDGVKRRLRAGMGRCQGGFCSPRVTEILARELGLDPTEITKKGKGSEVLAGTNR